ncbi:hypothetical protein [Tolypothrix sp. VBCCA 56010]|uniref:hypothetical protein n=1 Tax=Tolypothrix sp. VBCCA 56010 TaxID=3137731 RepID=UPI003D7C97AF
MYEQQDEQFFQYAYWETNRKQQLRHLETLLAYKTAHEEPIEDVIKAIQILQALQRGFWGQLLLRMSRRDFSPEFAIKQSFIHKIINLAINSLFFLLTTGTLVYGSFVVGYALGHTSELVTECTQISEASIDKVKD